MSTARIDELSAKFDENPRRYFAPLANEYRKAGDLTQAIALCREHLPKQPGHMSGHIVFGQALYESGELSEAQTVFQAALDLDPENLIALRHLGDIARARGDDPLARRWYERVLDADPRNDDIAALLATLSARMTPHSMTPVSTPVVPVEAPTLDLDAMSDADDADDPFSAADSPAWHTPSFLTPLASAAVEADGAAESDAFEENDAAVAANLPAEMDETIDVLQAEYSNAADAAASDSDDLLDLDFSVDAADAADAADRVKDADADAMNAQLSDDVDVLSAALGAFASHDLENADTNALTNAEITVDAADDSDVRNVAPVSGFDSSALQLDDVSASFDDDEAFEEGLVAQEWPDTSGLTTRVPTPGHSLPIVLDTYEDELSVASSVASNEATVEPSEATVKSNEAKDDDAAALNGEESAHDFALLHDPVEDDESDSLPDAPLASDVVAHSFAAADDDVVHSSFVGTEVDVVADDNEGTNAESVADVADDALVEEADDVAYEASIEHDDSDVLVPLDDTVPVHAHVPAADEETDDFDDGHAVIDSDDDIAAEFDEDPPTSASGMPWMTVPEAEPEADGIGESEDAAEPAAEHVPEETAEETAEQVAEEEEQPAASPAFVTETMAELLVAQGFVARAADVYEELIARRPYDAVLTFRLQELRAMLAEQPKANETPAPVNTPARSGTPVYSATPVADVAAIPFAAPPVRRSAREVFASLASMRVSRRTPAFGSATVAMPTPADGLASLFGESPTPADDLTARAMARAFGSGDGVEEGPSMFTPSTDAGSSRGRPTPASVPPVPSGPAFSFDRFFPDPATTSASAHAADNTGSSQASDTAVASQSGEAPAAGPSSAGADLAHFSQWLKGLSNT